MRRFERKIITLAILAVTMALGVAATGCAASGVGDPCTPEAVPTCGFANSEVYVETSSVQCRTRVCVVYRLDGHPENLRSEGCPRNAEPLGTLCMTTGNPDTCVEDGLETPDGERILSESDERVFCSCRCRANAANPNLPLCACEAGYHCADEDFCVPNDADPRFCDYLEHYNCPGRCDVEMQRCR